MSKSQQHEIAERIVVEMIRRGVIDDRRDVDVRVFAPNLSATEIAIRFPDDEAEE